jgi:hypothetical protein
MNSGQKVIKYIAMAFAVLLSISIICAIVGGIGMALRISGAIRSGNDYSSSDSVSEEESFEKVYTNITGLDIKSGVAGLTIQRGEELKVEAVNIDSRFQVTESQGTLKIENKNGKNRWFFNWGSDSVRTEIIITVPETVEFDRVQIECGVGASDISDLQTERLDFSMGAGQVIGSGIYAKRTEIEGGVGELSLEGCKFGDLDLECGVGEISIDGEIYGRCDVECGVGEINLNIRGSIEDYDIRADKGIGEIRINGERYSKDSYRNSAASNKIDIDGGIGAINLSFY